MSPSYRADAMHLLHLTPVRFLGFKADMASLYSFGWQVQVDHDLMRHAKRACLVHRHLHLAGFIEDFSLYQQVSRPLEVEHIYQTSKVNVVHSGPVDFRAYQPADYVEIDVRRSMEEVRLEEVLELEESKELIVDPNEVQSLLDRIIEVQRPAQAGLREKSRKAVKHTAAKIITLAEYRA